MANIQIKFKTKEFERGLTKLKGNTVRAKKEILGELAIRGMVKARSLAPLDTGQLRSNIKFQIFKDFSKVISFVNKPFAYHLWVNAENRRFGQRDMPTVRLMPPFGDGITDIEYGDTSATTPSGRPYAWTAQPGYFIRTFIFLLKEAPILAKEKEAQIKNI